MSVLKTSVKLLLLIAACAGVYYYVHTNNIDLKALFSSSCDCHAGGCSINKKPTSSTPAENLTKEHDLVADHAQEVVHPEVTNVNKAEDLSVKQVTAHEAANEPVAPKLAPLNKPVTTTPEEVK